MTPTERTPEPALETSWLTRPLQAVTAQAVRFPKATIALALAITVVALAYAGTHMGFRNNRADLLNPRSEYHQRWLAYTKEFGDQEDILVVIESETPAKVLAAMNELADALARQPESFTAVAHECDLTRLRGKGLHYLTPEQLADIDGLLNRATPVLQGDWNALSLGQSVGRLAAGAEQMAAARMAPPLEMAAELDRVTESLSAALASPETYRSPWSDGLTAMRAFDMLGRRPFVADEGKLGFVMLKLAAVDRDGIDPHTQGLNALRQTVAQAQAKHADVRMGLTGLPVIENDEMHSSQTSMGKASVLSLIGVALVFLAGFGGWRHPLIGNVALMAGMAWAYGFAALSIGHLNILSSAFAAILIGQGIDFGVYYLAGYIDQRRSSSSSGEALVKTAGCVGPGIATGAMSTAIAFFAAGFTEFTGVAELGMIAGSGILLCFLAAILLLPAMIQAIDAGQPAAAMPCQLELGRLLNRFHARPAVTLTMMAAAAILAAVGLGFLRYDHNLMNLQPAGMESVRLGITVAERTGHNAYFALSTAESREEALSRKEMFLRQPSVAQVEEIASVMPNADPRRQPLIEGIHARLANLPVSMPPLAVATVEELDSDLAKLQALTRADGALAGKTDSRLKWIRETICNLYPAEVHRRLDRYQQRLAADMLQQFTLLKTASDPNPPQWSDVSAGMVVRFVGKTGKHLLKVYSRADIWDMPATERFISEVRSVDRNATGNPMQIYESSRQMKQSYEQAALYATIIVFIVVYLDFGSLWYTMLAILPLGLGMLQMFGVMGLLNIPLNAANMIVLPLILGIGVDNGVHVVHDFRRQQGGQYQLSNSTANAVFINSLGNMVGFGCMMVASHQGLQSLGRVLTIGMACCLLSALALPSLLMLLSRRARQRSSEADFDDPETISYFVDPEEMTDFADSEPCAVHGDSMSEDGRHWMRSHQPHGVLDGNLRHGTKAASWCDNSMAGEDR